MFITFVFSVKSRVFRRGFKYIVYGVVVSLDGSCVGSTVGAAVGSAVGAAVGVAVGACVAVGAFVGVAVGAVVGVAVGLIVAVGFVVGLGVAAAFGVAVDFGVAVAVGEAVCVGVAIADGETVTLGATVASGVAVGVDTTPAAAPAPSSVKCWLVPTVLSGGSFRVSQPPGSINATITAIVTSKPEPNRMMPLLRFAGFIGFSGLRCIATFRRRLAEFLPFEIGTVGSGLAAASPKRCGRFRRGAISVRFLPATASV